MGWNTRNVEKGTRDGGGHPLKRQFLASHSDFPPDSLPHFDIKSPDCQIGSHRRRPMPPSSPLRKDHAAYGIQELHFWVQYIEILSQRNVINNRSLEWPYYTLVGIGKVANEENPLHFYKKTLSESEGDERASQLLTIPLFGLFMPFVPIPQKRESLLRKWGRALSIEGTRLVRRRRSAAARWHDMQCCQNIPQLFLFIYVCGM